MAPSSAAWRSASLLFARPEPELVPAYMSASRRIRRLSSASNRASNGQRDDRGSRENRLRSAAARQHAAPCRGAAQVRAHPQQLGLGPPRASSARECRRRP